MRIFYSPRRSENGSLLVRALLRYAYFNMYGSLRMPNIEKSSDGKPFFPDAPHIFFSLSHTDNFVLCALGEYDVGADIQFIRPIDQRLSARVCAPDELAQFDFFRLWALKESVIKLFGKAPLPLCDITFTSHGGEIMCSIPGVTSKIYDAVPSCSIAASSFGDPLPDSVEFIQSEKLRFAT